MFSLLFVSDSSFVGWWIFRAEIKGLGVCWGCFFSGVEEDVEGGGRGGLGLGLEFEFELEGWGVGEGGIILVCHY